MAKKKKKASKKGGSLAKLPIILTIGITLTIFIKTTFVFLLFAMLPAFVASYADTSANRRFYRSVVACNLSGVLPTLVTLMESGNTTQTFLSEITHPSVWFFAYASAGVGWGLVWLCPLLAEFFIEFTQRSKISRIESTQKKLVAEWGPEIMGNLKDHRD